MNLIDRYLYAVSEHLSEDVREDISRELRANIEEMLPENATEEDIKTVLEKLGDPKKLAAEYSQVKRYLIGPELYDSYISVLKLVTVIVSIVFASISLIGDILKFPAEGQLIEISIRVFVNTLAAVMDGILQGCLWVTLAFAIIERTGVNEGKIPFMKKKWSPDDLLTLQVARKRKISRGETVFSIICTVLFVSVLYLRPQFIGLYTKNGSGLILAAPVFEAERLQVYLPVLLIFTIIALGILIWKFISSEWSYPLAAANAVYNIALCILVYVMINDNLLLSKVLLPYIAGLTHASLTQITGVWLKSTFIFGIVFIIISIWDSIAGFLKCTK